MAGRTTAGHRVPWSVLRISLPRHVGHVCSPLALTLPEVSELPLEASSPPRQSS